MKLELFITTNKPTNLNDDIQITINDEVIDLTLCDTTKIIKSNHYKGIYKYVSGYSKLDKVKQKWYNIYVRNNHDQIRGGGLRRNYAQ